MLLKLFSIQVLLLKISKTLYEAVTCLHKRTSPGVRYANYKKWLKFKLGFLTLPGKNSSFSEEFLLPQKSFERKFRNENDTKTEISVFISLLTLGEVVTFRQSD